MGERAQRKRFARALDDEAAQTDDEQLTAELAIVGQLRQASTNTATDQQTRHDIAARMSAKAVGTESEPPAAAEPTPPTRRALPVLLRRPWLRPVLAATLTLATALTTLAVAFSTGSTPGAALYAVKRARESTALALTFDDRAAALTQLDHAAERVTELTELATRPEQHDDIADAYRTGLSDFDQATRAAAVTLTTIGTNADGDLVDRLRQWSHRQEKRLDTLRPALAPAATVPPTGTSADGDLVDRLRQWSHRQEKRLDTLRPALAPATAHRQADSATLLHRIQQRTTQLHDRLDCYRITTGAADNLGPLPATGSCATPPKQRFDEHTTHQNDTHAHPADPEPPDDGDSSHT